MSLSELLQPPNPDGSGNGAQDSTPRALSLTYDASLGGATRTGSDAGSLLDNLLQSIGAQFRTAAATAIRAIPVSVAAGLGDTEVELLHPVTPDGPVARFLAKRWMRSN